MKPANKKLNKVGGAKEGPDFLDPDEEVALRRSKGPYS